MTKIDFHEILESLVKGEFETGEWIAWWKNNAEQALALCNPGQRNRLKLAGSDKLLSRAALGAQKEAKAILKKESINVVASKRYEKLWREELDLAMQKSDEEDAQKAKLLNKKSLPNLKKFSPEFTGYLKRNLAEVESLELGADDSQIEELENRLDVKLPSSLIEFFKLCQKIEFEGFRISLTDIFAHSSGFLCIGEYWLEADGDQLLISTNGSEEIFYYAHESSSVTIRSVGLSMQHFLDELPNQL